MSKRSGCILVFLMWCWLSVTYFSEPGLKASNIVQSSAPSGPAGGILSGTYPNPGIATGNVGSFPFYNTATTLASAPTWTTQTIMVGNGAGTPVVTGVTINGTNDVAGAATYTATYSGSGGGFRTGSTAVGNQIVVGGAFGYSWNGQGGITSPGDGLMRLTNNAGTDWGRLQLGGTTSAFPSIKRSGTITAFRLADDSADSAITASNGNFSGFVSGATVSTATACGSAASPAVCGSAAAGSVAIPTGVNPTLQVNTSAVTAISQILLQSDDSLGTRLSVTCNSTLATLVGGMAVTARSNFTSFTISFNGTVTTNPLCLSYLIIN